MLFRDVVRYINSIAHDVLAWILWTSYIRGFVDMFRWCRSHQQYSTVSFSVDLGLIREIILPI